MHLGYLYTINILSKALYWDTHWYFNI